jgi:putative colanic acid biosynthesis UDP-glucose lipid carrier transferase
MANLADSSDFFSPRREPRGALHMLVDDVAIVATAVAVVALSGLTWTPYNLLEPCLAALIHNVVAGLLNLYPSFRILHIRRELFTLLVTWPLSLVLAVSILSQAQIGVPASGLSHVWGGAATLVLILIRIGILLSSRLWLKIGRRRRVAIFGSTRSAEKLCMELEARPWLGFEVIQIYDDRCAERRYQLRNEHAPASGTSTDLIAACRAGAFDEVFVCLPLSAAARLWLELTDTPVSVSFVGELHDYDLARNGWRLLGKVPIVNISDPPVVGPWAWLKRMEDLLVGSVIVLTTALPMLVIAIAIKVTSPGPVLFGSPTVLVGART